MKKAFRMPVLLFLAACLLLFTPAASAAVLTGLPSSSSQVQDIYYFCCSEMSFGAPENNDGQTIRSMKGNRDVISDIVQRYVSLLTDGNWNFTLNHEHLFEYKKYKSYSVTLTYTGSADIVRGSCQQMFDDAYYGDIMIYYSGEYGQLTGKFVAAAGLSLEDLGLRSDGNHVDILPIAESAEASLVQNSNGSFSTSDGRLRAGMGQAMILRDGLQYTTGQVSLDRMEPKSREQFLIENYCGNDGIALAFPYNSLSSGDSFGPAQLGQTTFHDGQGVDRLSDYFTKTHQYIFGACHNGSYLWCHPDPSEEMQDVLVRIMRWDPEGGAAVVYFAYRARSAPNCVEGLAVFSIGAPVTEEDLLEQVTLNAGESHKFSFTDREYEYTYELYKWEIVYGGELIEHDEADNLQDFTVKAVSPGRVRLKVTYSYGTTEPDVLTGIPMYVEKQKIKEFILTIPGGSEDSVTVDGGVYRLADSGKSAVFTGPTDQKARSLVIRDTVSIGGKSYKVTEISGGACKGMSKLATLTIGKNVKSIGSEAFRKCKKAKTITLLGTALKKVGKNAFDGTPKKAVILCPKKKIKAYKKLLTAAGLSKSAGFRELE